MSVAEVVPINWAIIRNPINWVTFFLMVLIFGVALHLILQANSKGTTA